MSTPTHRRSGVAVAVLLALVASVLGGGVTGGLENVHFLSISDVAGPEGDSGSRDFSFTVTLSAPSATAVTVNHTTEKITAQDAPAGETTPADYTFTSRTLTFEPGQTSRTIVVPVTGDTLPEPSERFRVRLTTAVNGTIRDGEGIGTITNDDVAPAVLSVSDAAVAEGDTAVFTITRTGPSTQEVRVGYSTPDGGTATGTPATDPGSDYTSTSDVAIIAAGATSTTVSVPTIDDTIDEVDETFFLTLAAEAANAEVGEDNQGTGTIRDGEATPTVSVDDATGSENNGGATTPATFTITLLGTSDRNIVVQYTTGDRTATAGTDYDARSGTVTFAPGDTKKVVTVPVREDALDEPLETFSLTLTPSTGATCGDCTGDATIVDDDSEPTLTVADVTAAEGADATFTIVLSGASGRSITVSYGTAEGTATEPEDFIGTSGTVTFDPGETREVVTVPTVEDALDEPGEVFTFNVSHPAEATCGDCTGKATIEDDDSPPTVSVADATGSENNRTPEDPGATPVPVTFTIVLSGASGQPVTVGYRTSEGTATDPEDYVATLEDASVTFAPGETRKDVSIEVVEDRRVEAPAETFTFTVTPQGGRATCGDCTATGTILDDESAQLSVSDTVVTEGDPPAAGPTATFTITLSEASDATVTFGYATVANTAREGEDYAKRDGIGTIAAGQTSTTVDVPITNDVFAEPTELFFLDVTNVTNVGVRDGRGEATITDDADGTVPALSINDGATVEGTGTDSSITFTVTLTRTTETMNQTVRVRYATRDLVPPAATAGADYTPASDELVFGPTETSKTIRVAVEGDAGDEVDERFEVVLSSPSNAAIADGTGVGTIDDDDGPAISIADTTVAENTASTPTVTTFRVTLSEPSLQRVTVRAATADGTAIAPGDYTGRTNVLVTFEPGDTEELFTVEVRADDIDETDEAFAVNLADAAEATIADASAVAAITDDDGPAISISDAADVTEGETTATFTVTLSGASPQVVTVQVQTADDTATAPADYTGVDPLTLTFAPGERTKVLTVAVKEDTDDEIDEEFVVRLSNPSNSTIADGEGTARILDDDGPNVSIGDVTVPESDAAEGTPATFTIRLSAPSPQPVTVTVSTSDGTAVSPNDYTSRQNQQVAIQPGDVEATFQVEVIGDDIDESDETFTVTLAAPVNATLGDETGRGTIVDDDGPVVSVNDLTIDEAAGTATFLITLSAASSQVVTVRVQTNDDTAEADRDYTGRTETVQFAANDTTEQFTVAITNDSLDEAVEAFTVELSAPTNAMLGDGSGTGTITDDDATPSLSISGATVTEGDVGTKAATFTVSLSAPSGRTVTVEAGTASGTATAGTDYLETAATLTFAPGDTAKPFTVTINGDTVDEADETFTVNLVAPTYATISDGTGTGTITDDDAAPAATTTTTTTRSGGGGGTGSGPQGYSLVGEDGSLYAFGTAKNLGDMRGTKLNAPIIGVAYTPGGDGYWLVAQDGGIFTFGNAEFFGSMGATRLNSPVIGMAATPTGEGYWLFAGDGGIFTFGDAQFFGSMGGTKLNAPVINMEPLESGNGYWLVAGDGGIFTFGQAKFFGSMGDQRLNQPVFDMTSTDTDDGYWLVARDGGIFSFGDAGPKFYGSAVNEIPRPTKVIGMDATPGSLGYWIADASGKVYEYGNAQDLGDRFGQPNPAPMISFASVPGVKP